MDFTATLLAYSATRPQLVCRHGKAGDQDARHDEYDDDDTFFYRYGSKLNQRDPISQVLQRF